MRKRYFGDTRVAQEYTRDATVLLDQVKQQMQYAGLFQLSQRVDLPNGVIMAVSSVFGQDEIRVFAPPGVGQALHEPEAMRLSPFFAVGGEAPGAAVWRAIGAEPIALPLGEMAYGVSKGGVVAVGESQTRAAIWDNFADRTDLGFTEQSRAEAVSWDGAVVVGGYGSAVVRQAFVWKRGQGLLSLTASGNSDFFGISKGGDIACGRRDNVPATYQIATGVYTLLETPDRGIAYGVSADGRVVCGEFTPDGGNNNYACVWVDGVRTQLSSNNTSRATAVSHDGRVVSGSDDNVYLAWYWTSATGRVELGSGMAEAVSEFGRYATGESAPSGPSVATVWDLTTGAATILPGAQSQRGWAISAGTDYITERPGEPPQVRSA